MHSLRFIKLIGIFSLCLVLIGPMSSSPITPLATADEMRSEAATAGDQIIAAHYTGRADQVAALNISAARPLSLTAADLDEDGILDVIADYTSIGGVAQSGLLSLQRGNAAAIYPYGDVAHAQRAAGTFTDAPVLPEAVLIGLAETPNFLAASDFDGDGHADILAGAAGSRTLYLLQGDAHGELAPARPIALPGQLSGLIAGEFDAPDGLAEVLVALDGPDGSQLAIFASPYGALTTTAQPTLVPLPARRWIWRSVTSLAIHGPLLPCWRAINSC